jgi:hypothetical protein
LAAFNWSILADKVHNLEVELENLRREPVEKSEYILANEESKNKELLLDDELQRLRLTLSEKHKEESDKLHVKIHQLEDEVLKLNSLVNEKSETLSDNQNMNEEIRELDSNRDDLTVILYFYSLHWPIYILILQLVHVSGSLIPLQGHELCCHW